MLILAYLAEGATRTWSEAGITRPLAVAETFLSLAFFVAVIAYARHTQRSNHQA
jgi:uncharacterized membrane protein